MDSASFQFVACGLAVAILSNLSRSPRWRLAVLLLASIAFLAMLVTQWMQLAPLAGFLLLGFGSLFVVRGNSRLTPVCICSVLATYLWLKKYTLLPHDIFLTSPYLALGLSYILFRVLHLIIESGDPSTRPRVGAGAYLAYTLNFTTFVSGPIQRYSAFAEGLFNPAPAVLTLDGIAAPLERIVRGLFKVNVIALFLNIVRTDALARLIHPSLSGAKFFSAVEAVAIYPLFLYANFSGYIDVVIGLARLMRIRLPENFDRPFAATSFIEFWSRWHITLSTWLKNYVYSPMLLALSRRFTSTALQPTFAVLSLFVTFFLIGVWHGRTSEFAVFGVLSALGVSVNLIWKLSLTRKLGTKRYRSVSSGALYEIAGRGLTFTWFAFTQCWFWGSWAQLDAAWRALGAAGELAVWTAVFVFSALLLAGWELLRKLVARLQTSGVPLSAGPYVRAALATAMVFFWLFIGMVVNQPAPDIVYKVF